MLCAVFAKTRNLNDGCRTAEAAPEQRAVAASATITVNYEPLNRPR
jgi:hypothetical protein